MSRPRSRNAPVDLVAHFRAAWTASAELANSLPPGPWGDPMNDRGRLATLEAGEPVRVDCFELPDEVRAEAMAAEPSSAYTLQPDGSLTPRSRPGRAG